MLFYPNLSLNLPPSVFVFNNRYSNYYALLNRNLNLFYELCILLYCTCLFL